MVTGKATYRPGVMLQASAFLDACARGDLAGVQACIRAGQNVSAVDDGIRRTPLHRAAYEGHTAVVEALIAVGASASIDAEDTVRCADGPCCVYL